MKKAYLSIALIVILGFSFSFHVLRLDDGFDIITKETLTLRDTYADVRNWGWTDYLSHSPRIRRLSDLREILFSACQNGEGKQR